MRVLCDVHLPIRLAKFLSSQGVEAIHVNQILDKWETKDEAIASYADARQLIVITKDVDFRTSFLLRRTPKKLLRICVGNLSNDDLINLFKQHLDDLKRIYTYEYFYLEMTSDALLAIAIE